MKKDVVEDLLFYHKVRLAKNLVGFGERLLRVARNPDFLVEGLFQEWYQFYIEGAGKELTTQLSKIKLSRLLAFYEIHLERRYNKKDKGTCYGLELNQEKLEMMIEDLKKYSANGGGTIVYVEGVPYFMQVAMIPVDDKIKKALSGRAKSKD